MKSTNAQVNLLEAFFCRQIYRNTGAKLYSCCDAHVG